MKAGGETHEQATVRMLSDPDSWPFWPYLPVTRRRDFGLALVFNGGTRDNALQMAVGVNLFDSADKKAAAEWKTVTPDAVVIDGWLVD